MANSWVKVRTSEAYRETSHYIIDKWIEAGESLELHNNDGKFYVVYWKRKEGQKYEEFKKDFPNYEEAKQFCVEWIKLKRNV